MKTQALEGNGWPNGVSLLVTAQQGDPDKVEDKEQCWSWKGTFEPVSQQV